MAAHLVRACRSEITRRWWLTGKEDVIYFNSCKDGDSELHDTVKYAPLHVPHFLVNALLFVVTSRWTRMFDLFSWCVYDADQSEI